MAIKDDIQKLIVDEANLFKVHGRYIQALSTPEVMPSPGNITNFTKLRKPSDENIEITFNPTAKDYQFQIDVWSQKSVGKTETFGFIISAYRNHGNKITERIATEGMELNG